MKKKERYNYDSAEFESLRMPMRDVMRAYGEAERRFAALKEYTWSEWGLEYLTDHIHRLEHKQPEYVDEFKTYLSDIGLEVEYPGIEEVIYDASDLDEIFAYCVEIIDNTEKNLVAFVDEIDLKHREYKAIAREVETLMIQNSTDRRFLLAAWAMYDTGVSLTSFDNWVKHHGEED